MGMPARSGGDPYPGGYDLRRSRHECRRTTLRTSLTLLLSPSITCHTVLVQLIQGLRLLGIFVSSSLRGHYTQSRGMVPSLKHETRRAF